MGSILPDRRKPRKKFKINGKFYKNYRGWDQLERCPQALLIDIFKKTLKINQNSYQKELKASRV